MIEAKGLYKGYGGKEEYVVKDVDIHVEPGTIHGLIGHNGSGKTTIIKCLTGIYQPDKGEVKIGGGVIFDNPKVKDKVGYVADSNQMFSTYRVKQLVKFYERIFPDFSKEEFQRLNNIFKVSENKRISQLSKGQQMRVSFMLNMARKPEVRAMAEALGYETADFTVKPGEEYRFIFNTVPDPVFGENRLERVSRDCIIIDIAGAPGGTDFSYCEKRGIKAKLCSGLPGIYSPASSGEILADAFLKIVKPE